jgi:hypothetical protein
MKAFEYTASTMTPPPAAANPVGGDGTALSNAAGEKDTPAPVENNPQGDGGPKRHMGIDSTPENIRELREKDGNMFAATLGRELADAIEGGYGDVLPIDGHKYGTPEEEATYAANKAEIGAIFVDLGCEPSDIPFIGDQLRALAKAPMTDVKCMDELIRTRGSRELANMDLQHARELIARDPRVWNWVLKTGLGNSPKFIIRAADLARQKAGLKA